MLALCVNGSRVRPIEERRTPGMAGTGPGLYLVTLEVAGTDEEKRARGSKIVTSAYLDGTGADAARKLWNESFFSAALLAAIR